MEPPHPSSTPGAPRRVGTAGMDMVRQYRQNRPPPAAGDMPPEKGKPAMSQPTRLIVMAAIAVMIVAAGIYWLNGPGKPATTTVPSIAREIDSLKSATTVAARVPFTGTCKETGKTFAFNVKGEVVSYANASRSLVAEAVKPQDVLTANAYDPPASISLDAAWWEASGGKAGRITLAAIGADARTRAPRALSCDVDLPGA